MEITDYIFIFSAIPIGILCGFLPSITISVAMIIMYPILLGMPFDVSISFWVVGQLTVYFTASVLALWLGIAGDTTTFPILSERKYIVKDQLFGAALKRTYQGSAISGIISIVFLYLISIFIPKLVNFFIYTYTSAFIISLMFVISILWKDNKIYVNFLLVISSAVVGNIGYHLFIGKSFLTFDHPWLYSGIPLIPVILGIYALPKIFDAFIDMQESKKNNTNSDYNLRIPPENVSFMPVARGTVLGFFMGLVPLFGSSVSSNAIYFIENKIKNNNSLDKITSSESANNASVIAALTPLLVIGVAILPSEMILLSILEDNGWTIKNITMNTFITLISSVIVTTIICYILCVNYAIKMINIFYKFQYYIMIFFVSLMIWGTYYYGNMVLQADYYVIVLVVSTIIGFIFRNFSINPIPFIIGFLLSTKALGIYHRTFSLVMS